MNNVTTNRRRFLLGLAAASTAAATSTDTSASIGENPKLIALSDGLAAIAEEYHAARAAYLDMMRLMEAATPLAPDEVTVLGTALPYGGPKQEGDTEFFANGCYLYRAGEEFPRRIVVTAWEVSHQIRMVRRELRAAKRSGVVIDYLAADEEANRLTTLQQTVKTYEKKHAEVRRAYSGEHKRLYPILEEKRDAFARHVGSIMAEEDRTMEGLVIKAQSLVEWGRVEKTDRLIAGIHGGDWHGAIAASILRHAAGDRA